MGKYIPEIVKKEDIQKILLVPPEIKEKLIEDIKNKKIQQNVPNRDIPKMGQKLIESEKCPKQGHFSNETKREKCQKT